MIFAAFARSMASFKDVARPIRQTRQAYEKADDGMLLLYCKAG